MSSRINYPSVTTKRVTVNSFANGRKGTKSQRQTDLSRAERVFNFDFSEGVLKRGVGVSLRYTYDVSSITALEVHGVFPYIRYDSSNNTYDEKVIIYGSSKCLYYTSLLGGKFKKLSETVFSERPTVIPYNYLDKDVLLISTPTNGLYMLDDLTLTKIDSAPPFTSLCIHKERLFATSSGEGKSLWFSDDFDPTNWAISLDEAGFINFSDEYGKLIKVVSFLDYVYVFREYGISRVTAYGAQEEFSVDNLFGKHGKIIANSITDCGDFIMMLTTHGLYAFNGLNASKILSEYDDYILGVDNSDAKGAFDGRYFYLKLMVLDNGETKKSMLVYDTLTKASHLALNLPVNDLTFVGGSYNDVACCFSNSQRVGVVDFSGKYLNKVLEKEWESDYCDFGIGVKNKKLKRLSIYSEEEATLKVTNQIKTLTYQLNAKTTSEFTPCLNGEKFKFSIISKTENPLISNFTVYVDYIKERV